MPDIGDFTLGLKALLAPAGVITLEFPHVLRLLQQNQFDTIYHEHFSYHSLIGCQDIFARCGLEIFDVEKLTTHGGSLRVFVQHRGGPYKTSQNVDVLLHEEKVYGLLEADPYMRLSREAGLIRDSLRKLISEIKAQGGRISAYGAAAKGNTLLNFCGVTSNDIDCVYDKSVLKIGKYMPGSRIPIVDAERVAETTATHMIILPWNIKNEVVKVLIDKGVNAQIITAIPKVCVESIR